MKALDVLAKVSGIPLTETREIWANVQKNHALLEACPLHNFALVPEESKPLRSIYRCATCGGTIRGDAFHWWQRGVKDGRNAVAKSAIPET